MCNQSHPVHNVYYRCLETFAELQLRLRFSKDRTIALQNFTAFSYCKLSA